MPDFPNVLAIETAGLKGWPALETIEHLKWRARFSRGYTKRANSIQVLDAADSVNAGLRLKAMSGEYRARGLSPVFRVTPLTGPAITAALDQAGWEKFEESQVLATTLSGRQRGVAAHWQGFDVTDPDWSEEQARMAGYDLETLDTLRLMLAKIGEAGRGFLVYDQDRKPTGAALAVVVDGIGQFYNVVVDEDARRLGYGRAVMNAALNWASLNGAHHAVLQVLADNEPALMLYKSLGFIEFYEYHYRRDLS
ncbi:acetyltransferase [Devosia pacifica]|uniref:Acetyltransferase n=1 Tax=Devosia pacifica TaxID=1335967 RepID=A0A918VV01_9HYPH|nr:GNAT family N-acetyltransferase [Devosia pacifica]GHA26745.1 acetyltransferase [Devosia pacifica]